ncbi:hypothetical protein WR25_19202 [Diploscapter pachys]|uniref:non-specific serine/threonine protein kinase n=1 Tax=Diploscapter pachys TaxID=2018661 RepID=A0A2A2KRF8_9BILA|nr:hypothetical protein WR25_19202 [Diploscapter pachys]
MLLLKDHIFLLIRDALNFRLKMLNSAHGFGLRGRNYGPVHIPKGKVIAGWRVIGKLGEGACGSVYKAQHIKHVDKFAAIKAEVRNANKGNVLKLEVAVLKRVRDRPLMPKIYASGKKANFEYCVMTLYGESISHLISKLKSGKTSVSTQVRIGIHGLAGLKFLHDSGFVHRDVKPANMLMGVDGTAEEKFVHCCDFGLAREFVQLNTDDTGHSVYKLRPPRERAPFRGTARYCSIATHERKEQGRVDDLWALFYALAEFRTSLPWSSLKYDSREQIAQVKQMCPDEMLYGNSPVHFLKIASHLRTLDYYSRPDYKMIYDVLIVVMKHGNFTFEMPYDWSRNREPSSPLSLRVEPPESIPPAIPSGTSGSAPLSNLDGLLASISNRCSVKPARKETGQQKEDKAKKESPKEFKKKADKRDTHEKKKSTRAKYEQKDNKMKPSRKTTLFPGLTPLPNDVPDVVSPYNTEHFMSNPFSF